MKGMVVSGASSGVGRSIATHFAEKGTTVFAMARTQSALDDIAREFPGRIVPYAVDVSKREQVVAAVEDIDRQGYQIDALVNNAGVHVNSHFADADYDLIDRIVDVNIKGMLYCTRAVLPLMLRNSSGHIINISSVGGLHGTPKRSLYNASKYAMNGFADALAQELVSKGILVVTMCPGGIDTPLWDDDENPYKGDATKLIAPENIAETIAFIMDQPENILFKKLILFPTSEWHAG